MSSKGIINYTYPQLQLGSFKELSAKQLCKKIKDKSTILPKELASYVIKHMVGHEIPEFKIGAAGFITSVPRDKTLRSYGYEYEYVYIYSSDVTIQTESKYQKFTSHEDYPGLRELYQKTIKILARKGYTAEIKEDQYVSSYCDPIYKKHVGKIKRKFLFWTWEIDAEPKMIMEQAGCENYISIPILQIKVCCG